MMLASKHRFHIRIYIASFSIAILSVAMLPSVVLAEVYDAPEPQKIYSPYVNRDYPQNVYWGDSHLLFPLFSQGTN